MIENEDQGFAYSERNFINVGDDNGILFDSDDFSLRIKSVRKSNSDWACESLVIICKVQCSRSDDIVLCYSRLLNDDEVYMDDCVSLDNSDTEIEILIESCEIAYNEKRSAFFNFALENGKGSILARCNSLRLYYNFFSGKYKYQIVEKANTYSDKRMRRNELDLRVNSVGKRTHWLHKQENYFICNTIPIEIINLKDRDIAIEIDHIDVDGIKFQSDRFIGICNLSDVIFLKGLSAFELSIIVEMDYMPSFGSWLDISFVEIATSRRFEYEFQTYYDDRFEIGSCYIFFHEDIK